MEALKNVHQEENVLGQLFVSWIKDTSEKPSRENFLRIQEALEKGRNEKQFVMRSQRLGVNCAATIAQLLDRTPIEKIDLYGNSLRDHGVQSLSPLIRDSRTLTYLNLGANSLGPLACIYIAALLPTCKKLKYLILGSKDGDQNCNRIDNEAGKALAEAMGRTSTITFIDMNNNPIGHDGQDAFAAFATALENGQMTTLKLGGTFMSTASAMNLIHSIAASCTLEFLDLHNNDLGSAVGEALPDIVGARSDGGAGVLQTLLLQNNPKIRTRGLVPLIRALGSDQTLRTLNLAITGLADEGAVALANTLQVNNCLVNVNLADNGITETGAAALCEALRRNTILQSLGLSSNQVLDEGACAFAAVLESNSTLTQLELSSARISDSGAIALIVALTVNTALQELWLCDNHISDDAGQAIADLLEKNNSLVTLELRGNQVSHSSLLRIRKVLKRNRAVRDGETPTQLQQEVIRLHFQQYKLQETQRALKDLQRSRLELQDQLDRTEREAMAENEATAKRSKEIIEKILLMENLIQDLKLKQKQKEEDVVKGTQIFEQEMALLQERLRQDTRQREEKQRESDSLEQRLKTMERQREQRLADIKDRIIKARQDRDAWMEKQKIYRAAANAAQQKVQALEAIAAQHTLPPSLEREVRNAKKVVKKRHGDSDLIDTLLGA